MSTISLADIDERIRIFAENVRDKLHGFQPGESWWVVKHTKKSRSYYKNAISLTEQLGLSEEDMGSVLSSRWTGRMGSTTFTEY